MATGTETVLVVEDETAVRELTARILSRAGFKVLVARDGAEALIKFEKYPEEIHLLLTDVVMPQMSGNQLAELLVKARPGLRVLYMSGYTDNALEHQNLLDAGSRFIGKPFTSLELTHKVRDLLDNGPSSSA